MVKYLFDAHIFIWAFDNSPLLSAEARYLLGEDDKELYFSSVSVWEVAIKFRTKRSLGISAADYRRRLLEGGFRELPITGNHSVIVEALPLLHHDPFDRMLVAQALAEGCTLVTHDDNIAKYGDFVRRV